jgi:hypothetical protein
MSDLSLESARKNALLLKWEEAGKALAQAKETEMNLRASVIEAFYPTHKASGTENVELGNGFKLKAVFKQNYRLAAIEQVNEVLEKIEKINSEGKFVAERIVRWKPELDKKEYDNLGPTFKTIIDTVLIVSPATPALEIVEPKTKK